MDALILFMKFLLFLLAFAAAALLIIYSHERSRNIAISSIFIVSCLSFLGYPIIDSTSFSAYLNLFFSSLFVFFSFYPVYKFFIQSRYDLFVLSLICSMFVLSYFLQPFLIGFVKSNEAVTIIKVSICLSASNLSLLSMIDFEDWRNPVERTTEIKEELSIREKNMKETFDEAELYFKRRILL